jgi:hypothetical protein
MSFDKYTTTLRASIDGYISGWKHWCKSDTDLCARYAKAPAFVAVLLLLRGWGTSLSAMVVVIENTHLVEFNSI